MNIIFETPRLLLRQVTEADAALVLSLNSNPAVVKYIHEPKLKSIEEARKVITDIIIPQYKMNLGRWAIITKEDNKFIGWCGLKFLKELNEIDLGYRRMEDAWGKGYAFEAARHSMAYGFAKLNIATITGRAHIRNLASLRILEKIGMKHIKDEILDSTPVKTFMAINPYVA